MSFQRATSAASAIANLTAYIAYTSRGKIYDTEVPNDERALAAY